MVKAFPLPHPYRSLHMIQKTTILLVDDEPPQRSILSAYLRKQGHTVFEAGNARDALQHMDAHAVDVLLTDLQMPGGTGIELLEESKRRFPQTTVVIMTAYGTIEGAVKAIRSGAYDYISKPIELDALELLIRRIAERSQLLSENRFLREQLTGRFSFQGIISQSAAMEDVLNTAGRVAASKASVLIRGESGTGKELLARAIHFTSPRKDRPFVAVNCAALNENLLESELFGHERGAFTGADKLRKGRFELADTGTLFMDEIGDVPPATQVKLLRVLQEETFERVGGSDPLKVDVRIIAATNRNLEQMIHEGTFREDLYYRLNVVAIDIPPLRERRDDIGPSVEHFLARFARDHRKKKLSFSREAWTAMLRYDYPGNVRELENIVQRAVILARGDLITLDDLPATVRGMKEESRSPAPPSTRDLRGTLERLEKEIVLEALRVNGGNQSQAARDLGLSERNLRYRLQKWKVQ
jgi:DNA-binding NtrC family response regulator